MCSLAFGNKTGTVTAINSCSEMPIEVTFSDKTKFFFSPFELEILK
jgi:hypothetical protein